MPRSRQSTNPGACAAIMWFRSDLRLADNAALRAAINAGGRVIPVYVFDDDAAGVWSPGAASRWWLHESLSSLASDIAQRGSRLILRRGAAHQELAGLAAACNATTVYCTRRYEPWAIAQEASVRAQLEKNGIVLKRFGGGLLVEPEQIATKQGEPYKVYTPFWRALSQSYTAARPDPAPKDWLAPATWPTSDQLAEWRLQPSRPNWAHEFSSHWSPGEAGALQRLETFVASAADSYAKDRDRPDLQGTSRLSPHLAHGEISPRLIWYRARAAQGARGSDFGGLETFLKELVWREFSRHLLFHAPNLPEQPFRQEFASFPWQQDDAALKAWRSGRTGYPIVDAGMRELWSTGWMHNRVRMIVASFLIKDLMIPWQDGERWFWDTLVDADLASNAASWQWVAGSGADAAPYFRIFNPVTQGEKFDPNGDYVRRWVPEVANLPDSFLQKPFCADAATLREAGVRLGETYVRPIVDHASARQAALQAYQAIRS
ncbi:MAG: deoxyribodipyrimidine photo-lyase [Hyphomicrobiaceae bacterium]|nr:deoxyribodipyrimidine photo-lyase [Hyphomicrobiaceae bacterium]